MFLPIYWLVDFQYFKVRKPTILCYCPNLVSKTLICCLKSREFCPFSTLCSLVWVVNLFTVSIPERRIVCEPERRIANIRRMPIVFPMLAIKEASSDHDTHTCCLCSMLYYVSICHFSWVVYNGYTRPRGCLLSTRLTQMWPTTVMINVRVQQITKV